LDPLRRSDQARLHFRHAGAGSRTYGKDRRGFEKRSADQFFDIETCELSFSIVTKPAHGSLGGIGSQICHSPVPYSDTATVKYTPASGWSGVDTFTYRVRDGVLYSAPVTVTVTRSRIRAANV